MNEQERYDAFIRGGLAAGFTDDQIDFLDVWFGYLDERIKKLEEKQ